MSIHDIPLFPEFLCACALVSTFFIAAVVVSRVSVSQRVWEAKQGLAKQELAEQESRAIEQAQTKLENSLKELKAAMNDPWQTCESSSEDDHLSPIKAPKGKRGHRIRQLGLPEDFPSFISSLNALGLAPGSTLHDAFNPAQIAAEKAKNVFEAERAALRKRSKFNGTQDAGRDRGEHGALPQVKQEPRLDEQMGGPEPDKTFRTTKDGVLHVDYIVKNTDNIKFKVSNSRNGRTLDIKERGPLGEDVLDGIHPPQTAAATSKNEQSPSITGKKDPQKIQASSTLKKESRSRGKGTVLPEKQTAKLIPPLFSQVFVMPSCQPAWEAEQYVDHACNDDSDAEKALKKQFISAFVQYRKECGVRNLDLDEDEILQGVDDISDIPVEASLKSTNIKNKNMPVTTSVKVSKDGSDRPSQCMFFSKLPPEVRALVYRRVLTTTALLNAGAEIEKVTYTLITDDNDPSHTSNIDSALMRTCRKMYQETLPVLYGENKFVFRRPEDLEAFREGNLDTTGRETSVRSAS